MNVKGLISKLLVLKNSATFLLIVGLSFTTCHQIAARQNDTVVESLYLGPPVTTTSGSGSGTSK